MRGVDSEGELLKSRIRVEKNDSVSVSVHIILSGHVLLIDQIFCCVIC